MTIFDITTHLDFYNMLVDDFDDFMHEQHSARRAFHCILEAYHLREWVWHDCIEDDQSLKDKLRITNEPDFNRLINQHCPWFNCVKALTNGSKHFQDQAPEFEAYRVAASPFSFGVLARAMGKAHGEGPFAMCRDRCR
jgi:hypothetical protein